MSNETSGPVVSLTDEMVAELEKLAININGWNMDAAFFDTDAEWYVGVEDEDGDHYPLMHVDAHQYDSDDSEKLARYYAACNRNFILTLLAERAELKRDAELLEFMLAEQCIMRVQNGTGSPSVYSLWWSTLSEGQRYWYESPRAAINAAIQDTSK